jgi:hypothetical protein
MSSSKPPKTRTGADDASSLQTLLALSLDERREAVARDVRRRAPQFSTISAHDLADALDVPEHWRPGNEWSFTRYAPIVSAEEHARYNSPASELVYLIEDAVSAERFQQLLKDSEPLDDADDPSFAFLTKVERSRLEDAIAEKQMEANESNGMNCIARCSVESLHVLLVVRPLHTGQAAGQQRAQRHAQFPPHRPRPHQQGNPAQPQHRQLQVLRPVVQAGRLASPASPADRTLGEPIGGADRIQKQEQRREPRQDRRAHAEQLRADHRRLDALPVRHVAAPHDRVRDRQADPLANCVPMSWMPVASNTIEYRAFAGAVMTPAPAPCRAASAMPPRDREPAVRAVARSPAARP